MKIPDKVTLVDKNDNIIGEMDKIEAHRGNAQLHRASSVYLFRKNPRTQVIELLFQKRSSKKIVGAKQWGNTVCGNVRPIENYRECAIRRLKEELGVVLGEVEEDGLKDVYNFTYKVKCNDEFSEHEIDHVFVGKYSGVAYLNSDEVEKITWINWIDLTNEVYNLSLNDFPPEGVSLKSLSDCEPEDINSVVNPWTMLMLSDQNLIESINSYLETI